MLELVLTPTPPILITPTTISHSIMRIIHGSIWIYSNGTSSLSKVQRIAGLKIAV